MSSNEGEWSRFRDPTLFAILGLAFVGTLSSSLAAPALPGIVAEFGISEARAGLVMTAFFGPATLAIPLVGAVADRYGRRPVVLASLLLFGVAGVAIAVAESYPVVLVLRAIQGVAFPGTLPLSIALIGDLYAGRTATTVQGLRTSVNGVTSIALPAVAGVAAGFSWRAPFAIYVLAVPVLVLCVVALPDPIVSSGGRDEAGSTPGEGSPPVTAGGSSRLREAKASALELLGAMTPTIRVLVVATIALFLVRFALLTYVPLYLVRTLGATEATGGLAVSVLGLGRFVIAPTAGRVVEGVGARRAIVAGLVGFAAGTVVLALVDGVWVVVVVVALLSAGEGIVNPVVNDVVTGETAAGVRARVVSALEAGKTAAVAVSPAFFGAILTATTYRVFFLVGGIVVGAAGLLVQFRAFGDGRDGA